MSQEVSATFEEHFKDLIDPKRLDRYYKVSI